MNRPPEVTELGALLAGIEKHRREKQEKAKVLAALEKRLTPRVLASNPEAVQELAVARVAHQLADSAVEGAVQISREVAARAVPFGYALERTLRTLMAENMTVIREGITRRVGRFYTPERLTLVIANANAVIAEVTAESSTRCAKGDPTSAELHPDVSAKEVLDGILDIERCIEVTRKRQEALRREFA